MRRGCGSMVDAYVNSGESFILTTHRISSNFVLYDMVLTTQRLILINSLYTQFEHKTILLSNIQSVKGGKIATGESVITISFTGTSSTGESQPMNLIFTQQSDEQRKQERDEWLKILMERIVSAREPTIRSEILSAEKWIEIRPSGATQRPIEVAIPLKTISGSPPEPDKIVVLPDEPELPVISDEKLGSRDTEPPVIPVVEKPLVAPEEDTKVRDIDIAVMPVVEESPVALEKDSPNTVTNQIPKIVGSVEHSAPEGAPQVSGSSPPYRAPRFGLHALIAVTAIIIVILAIIGGVLLSSYYVHGKNVESVTPPVITTPAIPLIPTPTQITIPKNGVWIRVEYTSTFTGRYGNPGSLLPTGGSGDQFYMVQNSDGLVQAFFQKQDNSGQTLAVGIYRNGELIYRRTIRTPMGTIEFLIDPKTGNPPGIPFTSQKRVIEYN